MQADEGRNMWPTVACPTEPCLTVELTAATGGAHARQLVSVRDIGQRR